MSRSLYLAAAVAVPAALTLTHILSVYRQIRAVPPSRIITTDDVPDTLLHSSTVRLHVNPKTHTSVQDTRYTDLAVLPSISLPSDEALLAAIVRGFFGGRVFAPERWLLRRVRLDLVQYPSLEATRRSIIWSIADLPPSRLLDPHAILFGAFQIADISFSPQSSESYIDFIFGGNGPQSGFAGVHRFTVAHPHHSAVRITYAHISCNPIVDKSLGPDFVQVLHKLYADWLFREGVGEVMRSLLLL